MVITTFDVKYPSDFKDWHLYDPAGSMQMNVGPIASTAIKRESVKSANTFQKLIDIWKSKVESLFSTSFIVRSFRLLQLPFKEFNVVDSHFVIYQLKSKTDFFSIYVEDSIMKHLIDQALGLEEAQSDFLTYSELEQVFFQLIFDNCFKPVLTSTNVMPSGYELSIDNASKEKNSMINDSEAYYVYSFEIYFSALFHTSKVMFAFTEKQNEKFINKIKFPQKYPQITIDETITKKMKTNVQARLGNVNLTFGELQNLGIGDVLLLKQKVEDPVSVTIGDELKFLADIGTRENKIVVRLKEFVLEEQIKKASVTDDVEEENVIDEPIMQAFDEVEDKEDFESALGDDNNFEDDFDWENV